ncbi:MAG: tetratricopeptide repeat protein [Micropruina sp.]
MAGLGALLRGDQGTPRSRRSTRSAGSCPASWRPNWPWPSPANSACNPRWPSLYRICAATDANYVTPAGFGLARIRAAGGDLGSALAALELIPQTSRGYQESQKLTVQHLMRLGNDAAHLAEALRVLQHARLATSDHLTFGAAILEQALRTAGTGSIKLAGATITQGRSAQPARAVLPASGPAQRRRRAARRPGRQGQRRPVWSAVTDLQNHPWPWTSAHEANSLTASRGARLPGPGRPARPAAAGAARRTVLRLRRGRAPGGAGPARLPAGHR